MVEHLGIEPNWYSPCKRDDHSKQSRAPYKYFYYGSEGKNWTFSYRATTYRANQLHYARHILVRTERLELSYQRYKCLKLACLPVSPRPHIKSRKTHLVYRPVYWCSCISAHLFGQAVRSLQQAPNYSPLTRIPISPKSEGKVLLTYSQT